MAYEFKHTAATPTPESERLEKLKNPGFGTAFTDHMVSIVWEKETGWQQPEMRDEPVPLSAIIR